MLLRRSDGRLAPNVPAYRRMVPFLMRGRNESVVYFEQTLDLSRTLRWIDEVNRRQPHRVTLFHVVLASLVRVLDERPRLNRFVSGRRLHQRGEILLSFAAKTRFDDDAPLSVVKRRFDPDEGFFEMVARLHEEVGRARSDTRSAIDRELNVLLKLPRFALDAAVRLLHALDFFDLAPRSLLANDPMYASAFVANLGSLGLDAAYHHLYEHGNCPLFVTIGRVERAPVVTEDDRIVAGTIARLKYSFDERIEDGLYCARSLERLRELIQNPARWAL